MKKNLFTVIFILILSCLNVFTIFGNVRISIEEFGLKPNTGEDARVFVGKAIAFCKGKKNVILYFPEGRYDFYPDVVDGNTDILRQRATTGIRLDSLDNFTFDGGGSEFIFHGKMQIASVNKCTNFTLKNFSVDWDRPIISQAEIVNATNNYLDIKVDKTHYPFKVVDGKALFMGEGWELPIMTMYSTLYDGKTKDIAFNTWDATMGNIFEQKAELISDNIIRFHGMPKIKPDPGTVVILYHVRYFAQGISIQNSKNVLLKDITLYHALSNGFHGYRTENITMDNASVKVNDSKGRYFSIIADASHFSECKGLIKVINCAHTGQGDDFMNVHGTSVKITDIIDSKTLEVASSGKGAGNSITVGDEYWFIEVSNAQRGSVGKVVSKIPIVNDEGTRALRISFKGAIPKEIKKGDFLECKTWCPSLEVRNCQILRRHRARGILVTTPKKVVIENNYFSTAGTAILIEGDFDYWFESGANNNVKIQNNIFDNCLTSGNKNGSRAEWGEAVITITPSHIPQNVDEEPYHKNIHITNNIFKVFDAPLVRAVSTRGLYFINNQIIKTFNYEPYTWQQSAFLLDGCRDVKINRNKIDDKYTTRDISIEHMRTSDVKVDPNERFLIKSLMGIDTHMQW